MPMALLSACGRTFEVSVERGKSVSKKVTYTNPYAMPKALALRTTQPGVWGCKLVGGIYNITICQGDSAAEIPSTRKSCS